MSTISKNIFSSLFSSILQLYTGSVVFILLAKLMHVEDFGILSFGFSLASIATVVSDFGFSLMVIKDYPIYKNDFRPYFFNSVIIKILFGLLTFFFISIYVVSIYDGSWVYVGLIYCVFAIFGSFVTYFQALFKVQNNFNKFLKSGAVYAFFISLSVFFYWYLSLDLKTLVVLFLASRLFQLLYCILINKISLIPFNRYIELNILKRILIKSWSYGAHTILGILYFMVDTQIISIYFGGKEVALYQSIFRIILIFLVFSELITNVFLPYLSYKFYKKEDISELSSKIFLYLLIIGLSLFLFFNTFKSFILSTLYNDNYLEAGILVLPLSVVVVIRTVSSLLGNLMTVSNNQSNRVIAVCVSLFFSISLNLIFTPLYGIIAAAWINVIVHFVLFFLYLFYTKKEFQRINIFNEHFFFLILGAMCIYICQQLFNQYVVDFALVGIWILIIFLVMKSNQNYNYLKCILNENGVG